MIAYQCGEVFTAQVITLTELLIICSKDLYCDSHEVSDGRSSAARIRGSWRQIKYAMITAARDKARRGEARHKRGILLSVARRYVRPGPVTTIASNYYQCYQTLLRRVDGIVTAVRDRGSHYGEYVAFTEHRNRTVLPRRGEETPLE